MSVICNKEWRVGVYVTIRNIGMYCIHVWHGVNDFYFTWHKT